MEDKITMARTNRSQKDSRILVRFDSRITAGQDQTPRYVNRWWWSAATEYMGCELA